MKVIINGIGGRMGRELTGLILSGYKGAELVAGVDAFGAQASVPCYKNFDEVRETADCIIDFSHHSLTDSLLDYCIKENLPVVIATTGHTDDEIAHIRDAAAKIPVFYSKNMSVGIALLCELAKSAAKTFEDADIEIIEYHHNRKLDAPSGTALMLFDALKSVRNKLFALTGRSGQKKREPNEVGIHAIRSGNIVGRHEVIIGTDTQTITLTHEAHDRVLFAEGAVSAAAYLIGKPAGFYDMETMVK